MTKRGPQRSDHEWITLLSSRHANESAGAFTKRVDIPYTYLFALLKRYPEVAKLPAYANGGVSGRGKKVLGNRMGRPPKVRVLKPKAEKTEKTVAKLPAPAKKRGRPFGSKNKPKDGKPVKQVDKPTPKDPARSETQPIGAKSAEAMFYNDLSIALKTGRRLCISFQLMPEGA
jgi:hypothetical protein